MNENIVATEAVLADVLQNLISQLQSPLPAGVNKIGKVDVDNLNDYTTLLNEIKNGLSNIGTTNVDETLYIYTTPVTKELNGLPDISSANRISEICLLSNDSTYDIKISMSDNSGSAKEFILKAGEKIEGLKCFIHTFIMSLDDTNLPIEPDIRAPIRMIYKKSYPPMS